MRLKSALDLAHQAGLPAYAALQPEYNLIARPGFAGELQDMCVTHNIAALPYFGLASGFLTGKYRTRDDLGKSVRGSRVAGYLDDPRAIRVLAAMDAVVAETGATHAQIALAWLAAQPGVVAPIASATSIEQLDELIGAWELALTPEQLDTLTAAGA
jgi:aryl-alcohol dehydrogenase-like predicted oxidoreductase